MFRSTISRSGNSKSPQNRRKSSVSRRRGSPRLGVEVLEERALLNAAGLDVSFGTGGQVLTTFSTPAGASHIVMQTDNKIVVAGSSVIARYNPDGSLDSGFGTGGSTKAVAGSIVDAVIQADGKIVVAGTGTVGPNNLAGFVTERFLTDGQLDASFGNGGVVTTAFAVSLQATGVALEPDGKIVVGGYGGKPDFIPPAGTTLVSKVVRYTSNGSLDSTFGTGGIITPGSQVNDVAIEPDGKILIAGNSGITFSDTSR